MEFKGTKGKWKYEFKKENYDFTIYSTGSKSIAHTHEYGEEGEANAKLISCAPEMLEFIKQYYRYLNIGDQEKAEELIKKATTI